jgi:hypothetical protein
MARGSQVTLTFAGDTSSLERAVGRAGKAGSKLGSALKGIGTAGAVAGFVALGAAAKVGWDEFMQGQKVAAQTAAAIKSTGAAANVTAKQIDDLSTSLMNKSGIDDEAIASGANLLLTFTNIRNEAGKGRDIFNQATAAALDLSVAFGKDMASSSILVGKALNDPIKGISALSKVGVTFTESQKAAIKSMVAMGDTAGAQKLILAELARETGGSAAALGQTLPGQIEIAKQQFSNLAGEVVGKVVPAFLSVVSWVRTNWPQIKAVFQTVMDAVRAAIDVAIVWIKANVVPAIQGVIAAAKVVWERLGPIVMAVFNAVKANIQAALAVIKAVIETVMAVLSGDWSKAWGKLKDLARAALDLVVTQVKGFASVLLAAAKALGQAIWDGIKAGLAALAGLASHITSAAASGLATAASWVLTKAKEIGRGIVTGIWDGISGAAGWLKDKIKDFAGGLLDAALGALGIGSPSKVFAEKVGVPIAQGIAAGFASEAGNVTKVITGWANLWAEAAAKPRARRATAKELADAGMAVDTDTTSPGALAYAYAQLTTNVADDLAALTTLVTEAEAAYAVARKTGKAAVQAEAINALVSARSNLAGLGPMSAGGGALIQGSGEQERMALLTSILMKKAGISAAQTQAVFNVYAETMDPAAAGPAVVRALQEYVHRNGKLVGVAA